MTNEIDNADATSDRAAIGNNMIDQLTDLTRRFEETRQILDPDTMNSIRIILESIQEARAAYTGRQDVGDGLIKFKLSEIEVFFAKMAAVEEVLLP
jgi:hypothetical protein